MPQGWDLGPWGGGPYLTSCCGTLNCPQTLFPLLPLLISLPHIQAPVPHSHIIAFGVTGNTQQPGPWNTTYSNGCCQWPWAVGSVGSSEHWGMGVSPHLAHRQGQRAQDHSVGITLMSPSWWQAIPCPGYLCWTGLKGTPFLPHLLLLLRLVPAALCHLILSPVLCHQLSWPWPLLNTVTHKWSDFKSFLKSHLFIYGGVWVGRGTRSMAHTWGSENRLWESVSRILSW